jgi:shikimate kinase
MLNNEPIILIGPMKTGKTTIGRRLASQLNCSFTSLDKLEFLYANAFGYDPTLAASIQSKQGDFAWYTYRRRFFADIVIQFLAEHRQGVLELGGGHPIAPDAAGQAKISQALKHFKRVILLMPDPDIQESLTLLKLRQKPERLNPDLNELFLMDNQFYKMAKYVIYTNGKSAAETSDEIIKTLSLAA